MTPLATLFDRIESPDDQARVAAYLGVLGRKDGLADVYTQWERFSGMLTHRDNHIRSDEHRRCLLEYYQERFGSCADEKNTTLIRYDLQVCLREVYNQ